MTDNQSDGPAAAGSLEVIAAQVPLDDVAREFLSQCETTDEFLDALIENGFLGDAVRTLAMVLPVRQAVWWAVLAAKEGAGPQPTEPEDAALAAAVRWVLQPSEPARAAAYAMAGTLDRQSPGHACVRAIGFAGACAQPGKPLIAGDPRRTAKLAAAAVFTSLAAARRKKHKTVLRQLLDVGLDVRDGKLPWRIDDDAPDTNGED